MIWALTCADQRTADFDERLKELLEQGWEPFAVDSFMIWFRKPR
jgi:hypothetical protein